ncbi:BON domain-containing protein [Burkholderia sp. FL-7-2-10-S1-D7]|uniref:BON domain-containing protein n=1 Tax=Burkholderia sp. FL-7-2-10-S1-D7 TaxID=1637866 RepID=UPI000A6C201B|nr:BON domain-containing protein [Burkholderia sp. FL-7-2-10-S1-D7]
MIRMSNLVLAAALVFIGPSAMAQTDQVDNTMQANAGTNAASPAGTDHKAVRAQNRKLAKDVRHAFTRTHDLNQMHIKVIVKSGTVTLTGTVPEAAQIEMAANAAKSVAGVTKINNQLSVHDNGQ